MHGQTALPHPDFASPARRQSQIFDQQITTSKFGPNLADKSQRFLSQERPSFCAKMRRTVAQIGNPDNASSFGAWEGRKEGREGKGDEG